MDRVTFEGFLAQGLSLEEMGVRVDRHPSTVGYWLKKYGLDAVNREKHASRGPLARDELLRLVEAGNSIRDIAHEVARSPVVVRYWLGVYGLRTVQAELRDLYAPQARTLVLACPRHGTTKFRRLREGGDRCLKCRAEAVADRRRRVKEILVEEAGGACAVCGYDRCIGALEFHHVEPANKAFALSHRGVARSLAKARAEALKCVLLCSNCHVEAEADLRRVAEKVGP